MRIALAVVTGVAVAMSAAPVSAKISAMSGAYDGRGKPAAPVKPDTVKPATAKKPTRKSATVPDEN